MKKPLKTRQQGAVCVFVCFLLSPLCIQAQPCVSAPAGLVSWWQGEGNANDSADSNNGVLVNGNSFTPGKVGQAFNFLGTNHVEVAAAANLNVQSFTIEAWIFPADVSVYKPIVEYSGPGVHLWHSVPGDGSPGVAPGSLYANVGNIFGPYHFGTTAGVIPSNQWTHVAFTYDQSSGVARLFVNGTNLATANLGSITPLTATALNLGYRPSDGGTHFVGKMDEASLYNRALVASEIQAIFNAGSAGKCDPSITSQPASQSVPVGADVAFAVVAAGTSPLTYRWYFNVTNLLAATNGFLTLTNVQLGDAGSYNVVISNSLGSFLASSNATLTVTTPSCITAPTGLVSWWQGEGNANDAADGNNGAFVNGASFASGRVGQAFNLGGANHVQVPAAANLNVQSFTIEAWIFPTDVNELKPIVEYSGPGVHLWHSVPAGGGGGVTPGSLYANVGDIFGPYHFGTAGGVIPSNQWTHVALTYDKTSGVAQLFANGTSVATANLGSITPLTATELNLGYRPGGTHFVGKMDEVSIYNRALAASEIQALFNAGSLGKCGLPPAILSQPQSRTVRAGTNVTFNVSANGTSPLSYQWQFNITNSIVGDTNSSLTLSNVQPAASGDYTVVVSNSINSVTSAPANLKVTYVFVFGNGQSLTNAQYTFIGSANIQLQTFFTNGTIFYTLDGSPPSFASAQYTGVFPVTQTSVLRVITYSSDFFQSYEVEPISLTIIPIYTLTATTAGGGTVSVTPTNGPYVSNTVINVTATPASGWTFLGWLGDASSTNTMIAVTMNRNRFVTARFGTTLNTTVAGNGSITLNPPGGFYPFGTVIQLYGVPQPGNYFALWGNAGSGSSNPLNFTLTNANPTVSSLFASLNAGEFALTVIPNGLGQVTVNPQTNRYTSGDNVTLTATPNTGQQFIDWSGDASGTNSPLIVLMNQSKTITGNFTRKPGLSVLGGLNGPNEQGFRLTLTGEFGGHYRIDGSTNLLDWTELVTLTNAYGSTQFTDESATNLPLRFYRAVTVP